MEITKPFELSNEEESLLDMHGLLNLLNVINYELIHIDERLKTKSDLLSLINDVANAAELLKHPEEASKLVNGIESFIAKTEAALDEACDGEDMETLSELSHHRDNLKNIYSILRIRAQEIIIRHQSTDEWVAHSISDITENIVRFLAAIEKNSHGQYRIVHNVAAQEGPDYLMQFDVTSDKGETVLMPMIFQDVIRDLLANARKYTQLGGKIRAGLHAKPNGLRFIIEDNGIGIPEDSIEEVVLFGKRGSNVADRDTRGGGFGLTKAYFTTKRYGGRMWIDSSTAEEGKCCTEVGEHGTKIEIRIPYP